MRRLKALMTFTVLVSGLAACSHATIPDPARALREYQQAIDQGDSAALHAMLSARARQTWSPDDVARVVQRDQRELRAYAHAFDTQSEVTERARLELEDGSEVDLELRDGRYGIASAPQFPGGSPSPEGALVRLAHALTHHRFHALLRTLTPSTRSMFENTLASLARGLQKPRALDIQRTADAAVVMVPGGHTVNLRQTDGLWFVETFR